MTRIVCIPYHCPFFCCNNQPTLSFVQKSVRFVVRILGRRNETFMLRLYHYDVTKNSHEMYVIADAFFLHNLGWLAINQIN